MDMFEKMRQVVLNRNKINDDELLKNCKKRLLQIIKKKLETSFIGALDAFEKEFGVMWGINKKEHELTETEKDIRKLWCLVRNKVLDNGNAQIRAIKSELEQHEVKWLGYNYQFKTNNKDEE